jgi:hypothetical protein
MVNLVKDLASMGITVCENKVLANPSNKMILERSLDELM